MDVDRIRSELAGTRFGDVRWLDETGSTNADLLEVARGGAADGIVLVADHQTAGRGRLDRTWEAPSGSSLLMSILTRPMASPLSLTLDEINLIPTAVAVAAVDACAEVAGVSTRLKWPNDIVVEVDDTTRKVAGLLAESIVERDRVEALVVGIGINVNWPQDLPDELADIAAALNHLSGEDSSREDVLILMLRLLDEWYGELHSLEGKMSLVHRARELSATIGRRVRVELGGETIVGDAIDITPDGHLLVADDCLDQAREISAGDVIHLRNT